MDQAPPPPEVDVGTVLGETYEITKMIGRGGMGAVWAAKHLRLPGKRLAVKVLLGAAAADREVFARFRREAEIASQIGHPNIIEVLDFNTLPSGTPYLVLEFLDGEDLATRLQRGPIPLDPALLLVRQIGSALHAAHKADVVHRDLKPANIFLIPSDVGGELSDTVKVLDFGISKIKGSQTVQTQDSILLGTPQYMSPEQASGKNAELDQRTDVFALGAIVYEMLSGQPAFSGGNLVAVVFKVVYEAPTPLGKLVPSLPANVVAAVEKAMVKDPAQRYSDVGSFVADLTGRPLQTLDRHKLPAGGAAALAPTERGPLPASGPPSTAARGERVPATRAADEAAPRKPMPLAALAAAALAGTAGIAFAVIKFTSKPPPPPISAPVAAPASVPAPVPVPVPVPAAVPVPAPAPAAPAPVAEPTAPKPAHAAKPAKSEAIPPEIAADLDEADRALASGNPGEAMHLARRTLNKQKTSRAFSIIARAYCKNGDLGNAKATLSSVSGADRPRVTRDCKAAGVDLN